MKHGSLFSGIGGFDLAAEWMGWENVFHCEWNEFGQKILKHYWPNAISYGDITKTDFTIHRGRIDIITGGFPCQPYSMAGKRKGKEDDRHLWPEMLRAIREIQPTWIVPENVPGIINWSRGLVFEEVQADMEVEGYEVFPVILPAVGRGSVHRRRRVWFVAYRKNSDGRLLIRTKKANSKFRINGNYGIASNSESVNATGTKGLYNNKQQSNKEKNRNGFRNKPKCNGAVQFIANSSNTGLQRSKNGREFGSIWKGQKQQFDRFLQPDWENFPTQSPLCSRDDGISTRLDGITFPKWRNESIKAYGNAIVPEVALQIFKAIEEINNTKQ